MLLNNDVLSIISKFANIPIRYQKSKLIIITDSKCESCKKRMRRTPKSLKEIYFLPEYLEIDEDFQNETTKYIRRENTFIQYDKYFFSFDDACNHGLLFYYNPSRAMITLDSYIYGGYLNFYVNNFKIYVKKIPSMHLFYRAIKNNLELKYNDFNYLDIMKEYYNDKLDKEIIEKVKKDINIVDDPIKIVVRLCSECRRKIKQGYIFM